MKQIKTVIQPINSAGRFDNEVNELIKNGWVLNKREIIKSLGEMSDSFNIPVVQVLYAELERAEMVFEEITL